MISAKYAKMSPEDRAKQFLPFAALKGYEVALRAKEHVVVPKTDLSEERLSELDSKFKELCRNDMVECIYYKASEENYIKIRGILAKIDNDSRIIKVVNTTVSFDDIYDIKKI